MEIEIVHIIDFKNISRYNLGLASVREISWKLLDPMQKTNRFEGISF
jgi:hypothetical protein